MNNVKLNRKEVFDFELAVQARRAVDKQGRPHEIIAHGEYHMITRCAGVEFCFDRTGSELAKFPNTRLVTPFAIEFKLYTYLVYNPETMEVASMHQTVQQAHKASSQDDALDFINTTHPLNKPVLTALGLDGYPKREPARGL